MQKTSEIGNLFLKEFVRHLVLNSIRGKVEFVGNIPVIISPIQQGFAPVQESMKKEFAKPIVINNINALRNLKNLISNPSVTSIECPGPNKPVIIIQNGRAIPIGIKLNEEEIAKIMNEFSEKTKIPLVRGVFKARLGNFAITAVVSDYVGTRFIIQRMGPMIY